MRGQPYVAILPPAPFTQTVDPLRPKPLPDKELGVATVDLDASQMLQDMQEAWLNDEEQFITGLNGLADLFLVWEHVKTDMTHKPPEDTLKEGMARIQRVLDNLIPELRWRGGLTRFPTPSRGQEAQTVNILVTSLYMRSNLLQHLGQVPGITHQSIVR